MATCSLEQVERDIVTWPRDGQDVTKDAERDQKPRHELALVTANVTISSSAAERKRRQREREKAGTAPLAKPREEPPTAPCIGANDLSAGELEYLTDWFLEGITDALAGCPDRRTALRYTYRAVELDIASRRARAAEEAAG